MRARNNRVTREAAAQSVDAFSAYLYTKRFKPPP